MSTQNRIIKTLTFGSATVIGLTLKRGEGLPEPDQFAYNSIEIDQTYDSITIQNKSSFAGSYCLEKDVADSITVDLTPKDTVKIFGAAAAVDAIISEDFIEPFQRLRVFLNGAGNVDIVLNKERA